MRKQFITYEIYGELVNELTEMILNDVSYKSLKYIYAPPRGGLPIAVHLSHYLNLKFINIDEIKNIDPCSLLIVDDIADTGDTMKQYEIYKRATLYYKPSSIIKPDFYVQETTNWIVFPWEHPNEIPNRN